ncbi:MAG: hypothetical protein JO330_19320 [Mycobacteriaceae bacterium]|nr:hypothetical protein [Mycobacteriaceae bacterium]
MTTRWTTAKKIVGLAAMATAVTAAGWGVGAGAAQADPGRAHPHPVPHFNNAPLDRLDAFLDKRAPNGFLDRVLDRTRQ